ncbi:MAG: hypothetical protein AAGF68_07085 [Pseudomonadota bacterium]
MAAGSFFEATLDGRPPMALDLHRAEITLHRGDGAGFRASGALTTAQPGMTLDDRGAEGWEAPVGLDFGLGDIGAPDAQGGFATAHSAPDAKDDPEAGFFYYWDHTKYAALSWTLKAPGNGKFILEMSCASTEGHSVHCATPLVDISVSLEQVSDGDEALVERIIGRPWDTLTVTPLPDGGHRARHQQTLL